MHTLHPHLSPEHLTDQIDAASRSFIGLLGTARLLGLSWPRAVASANAATRRAFGIDLVHDLKAESIVDRRDGFVSLDEGDADRSLRRGPATPVEDY